MNALTAESDPANYAGIAGQSAYAFVLVPTVLGELDRIKVQHRNPEYQNKAKAVIQRIKGLRNQGSLLQGVTVNKTITVRSIAKEPNFESTLYWLDSENNDDRIIASILEIQCESPSATVVLVTGDINLQNKAEMANLPFADLP